MKIIIWFSKSYSINATFRVFNNVEYISAQDDDYPFIIIKYQSRLKTICRHIYKLSDVERIEFVKNTDIPSEGVAREENK